MVFCRNSNKRTAIGAREIRARETKRRREGKRVQRAWQGEGRREGPGRRAKAARFLARERGRVRRAAQGRN